MMNIRFQGNLQVSGPNKANVTTEIQKLDSESKQLGLGFVSKLSNCDGDTCKTGDQFGGFLLTDEDAVAFLKEQGMDTLDLTKDKTGIETDAQQFLEQKFQLGTPEGQGLYQSALAQFSYLLSIVHDKVTEKILPQ
jgi:hypothetical protein